MVGSNVGGGEGQGQGGDAAEYAFHAVPGGMHRLNGPEYYATVTDMLGSLVAPPVGREGELDGFDNNAGVLSVSEDDYARYLEAAELVAADVFGNGALKTRVVTCSIQDDATCVRSVISGVGLHLFRRPVLDAELTVYEKVYAAARARGELHEGALQQVLVALLASAQFLYRMEFPGNLPGTQPLTPYELASRLSYFVWSSAPDDALLAAADADELASDEQLSLQLTRMWDDPKSARFVQNFAGQWLGARRLVSHPVAPDVFPEWTPEVANAAAAEMYLYFDEFLREEMAFSGFFQGRARFVNGALGKLYGLDVTGTNVQRITSTDNARVGYVGLVGFLAMTSMDRRTSIPIRGNTILRDLLCTQLPPPPANVPLMNDDNTPRTPREYFEHVSQDELCGSCHNAIDPFGFALDSYDAIGRFRKTYPDGTPIDVAVQVPPSEWFPQGLNVNGLAGVADALTHDERILSCAAKKLYTYGMGRQLSNVDQDNMATLARAWRSGQLTLKELARRFVLAEPFRFHSQEDQP